jgi:hypothetical protein
MPCLAAISLISLSLGFSGIIFSISASFLIASNIPIRPLYPVLLQSGQPTGV